MSTRRSVVLVPPPFQGHITPMLQLGYVLESNGFSIVVAHTQSNAPDPSNHPTFTFLPLPDGIEDFDKSSSNLRNALGIANINCKSPLHDCLVQLKQNVDMHGEITCIIYDTIMHCVDEVAKSMRIPTIVLRIWSCACFRTLEFVIDLWSKKCLPLPECQIGDMVPNYHPFKFKDMVFPLSNDIPDEQFEFLKVSHDIGSSCAVIWNTMDELEHHQLSLLRKECHIPNFSIGPLHMMVPPSKTSLLEEDNNCIEWLDKQPPNSVIYISYGSIVGIDEKELMEMAWGLVSSKQPFIWVIRDIDVIETRFNSLVPDEFQKSIGNRGCIVKWAPQKKVLGHSAVGGFLSHCGWNSTIESISEGVPMICRPERFDQMINTRYVADVWKVGLEMDRPVDRVNVTKVMERLMNNVEGKDMRKRANDMKHKFQNYVKEDGSSIRCVNELIEFISTLPSSIVVPQSPNDKGVLAE